jgi:tetratricopeptide (TPR) repeat protein
MEHIESFEERVDILFEELELAIKWERPSILIAVYESEYVRKDVENLLEGRLSKLGQKVSHFHIDEKQFDTPMILVQNPDNKETVYFITGLKWGGGKGGFNAYRALNMRREFFIDNLMRAIFWLTKSEAANLPRHAPDFWAFRHRVVEFTEDAVIHKQKLTENQLSWDGWKSAELLDDIEEKIALRESMLADLPEGLESQASRTDLLYTLASYYWAKGNNDKSLELLNKGIGLAARMQDLVAESQFWAGIGIVYHTQKDFTRALPAYQKAVERNSYNIYAWNNLAIAYNDLGNSNNAIQVCRKAIDLNPRNSGAYAILGNIYLQLGQFEDAKESFQIASRLEPKVALYWTNLGVSFQDQGRNKEALRAYLKASRLAPQDAIVWKNLGNLYKSMNRLSEAKRAYNKALVINPDDPETRLSLAACERRKHTIDTRK